MKLYCFKTHVKVKKNETYQIKVIIKYLTATFMKVCGAERIKFSNGKYNFAPFTVVRLQTKVTVPSNLY
jgi:hypothetical protein